MMSASTKVRLDSVSWHHIQGDGATIDRGRTIVTGLALRTRGHEREMGCRYTGLALVNLQIRFGGKNGKAKSGYFVSDGGG